MRDCCYSCRYANEKNRPGDITLGDFWNIDKKSLGCSEDKKVSLVLINTKKGEALFESAEIPCKKREVAEAVKNNGQLRFPCPENADRKIFLDNYSKGFVRAVNKTCVRKNIRQNKIGILKQRVAKVIRKGK